jgi:putative hydrolase of the HAD superfamily
MKTFIFDYDDTLAPNQHYYSYAYAELIKFIFDRLGPRAPHAREIVNLNEEKDVELVRLMGFQMERFPESFKRTFLEISRGLGKIDDEGSQMAYDIAMKTYDAEGWKKSGFFNGVRETLDFLAAKGDELLLVTKGDPRVQYAKVEATGARKWFGERVYVVADKSKRELLTAVEGRDKDLVWHVGNSARSDIIPALEAGIGAIYVPQETWAYEKDHPPIQKDHPRLTRLKEVSDIMSVYDSLR